MTRPGRTALSSASWLPALVAAALWVISAGAFAYLTWFSLAPTPFVAHAFPETIASGIWHWRLPWVLLAPLGSACVVFLAYSLLSGLLLDRPAGSRFAQFFALWFVAVLTGFLANIPWVVSAIVAAYPPSRAANILDPAGDWMLLSGYWGLIWGWIPALIASRRRAPSVVPSLVPSTPPAAPLATSPSTSPYVTASAYRTDTSPRRPVRMLTATLAVGILASGMLFGWGSRAARVDFAALAAVDEGHTIGAVPDPDSAVTPPLSIAAGDHEIDPAWCTPDQAMVLMGGKDAATGHRILTIRASNFSEAPCVVDGYPDIAFADESGSELGVEITHGGSFMREDPGATPVTIPAGGSATASIGWDAVMVSADVLATYRVFAALYPGLERGSWPITLDIVEGSEVDVTAWELSVDEPSAP